MSNLDKLIKKVRQAVDDDVAAIGRGAGVIPPRLGEAAQQANPWSNQEQAPVYDIAASDDGAGCLLAAFREATKSGANVLQIKLPEGDVVPLLTIQHTDQTAEPCYLEGRTVAVTAPGMGRQVVTPYGGVVVTWDELLRIGLRIIDGGRTIEIEIGDCI